MTTAPFAAQVTVKAGLAANLFAFDAVRAARLDGDAAVPGPNACRIRPLLLADLRRHQDGRRTCPVQLPGIQFEHRLEGAKGR